MSKNIKNKLKYEKVFKKTFGLKDKDLKKDIKYNTIKEWDSVGHMGLIGEIEEAFEIELQMDDVIDFGSYAKGKDILKKYGIEI